jgi:hypothetical protein
MEKISALNSLLVTSALRLQFSLNLRLKQTNNNNNSSISLEVQGYGIVPVHFWREPSFFFFFSSSNLFIRGIIKHKPQNRKLYKLRSYGPSYK